MKQIQFIITNFGNRDIKQIPFDKYDSVCEQLEYSPCYSIISNVKQEACEHAVSMVFEGESENGAISKSVNGLNCPVVVLSTAYADRVDIITALLSAIKDGYHMARVKKMFNGVVSILEEIFSKFYNAFVKLFTGAHDCRCIPNLYAFDETVLKLINMFPSKMALMCNSNFLGNLNVAEFPIVPEFKVEKRKLAYKRDLILGLASFVLSIASLVVALFVPLSLSPVLWLIISFLLFALIGIILISKNVLDNKMFIKVNKKLEKTVLSKDKEN